MLSPATLDAAARAPTPPIAVLGPASADDLDATFEALVAEHLPALRARATQMCRGVGDPDDIVQDALVRAFRAREQMKDPARARGWLLTIVTNTFLDAVRRRKVRPGEVELAIDPPAPVIGAEAPWQRLDLDDVRAAVAELPDDVRDTYRMFALEGRDYLAIAHALGVPKATVGTRILRARKRLRELLAARIGGGP